jgi:hypothetical protein
MPDLIGRTSKPFKPQISQLKNKNLTQPKFPLLSNCGRLFVS